MHNGLLGLARGEEEEVFWPELAEPGLLVPGKTGKFRRLTSERNIICIESGHFPLQSAFECVIAKL